MPDSNQELHDVVHQRTRLGILTIALEVSSVQFSYLQEALQLTPGNLGRHLGVLEEAKLIKIVKSFEGRRPMTSISITPAGRRALRAEIATLKSIVERVERADASAAPAVDATRLSPAKRRRLKLA